MKLKPEQQCFAHPNNLRSVFQDVLDNKMLPDKYDFWLANAIVMCEEVMAWRELAESHLDSAPRLG